MTVEVARYDASQREAWNDVLGTSKNGLFLFDRNYMEYHSDRFVDFSAIAHVNGKRVLLCPATMDETSGQAFSHNGLTFGGFVVAREARSDVVIQAINATLDAMKAWGAGRLAVRLVPPYLSTAPSGEVEYALGERGFAVTRRDLSSLVPLDTPAAMSKNKSRDVARAQKLGVEIADSLPADLYPLLEQVLSDRHGTRPVHSLDELTLLQSRFPDRIVARSARLGGAVVAGMILYRYGDMSHTQYLASGEEGRKSNALDLAIADTIERERARGATMLSLGTSMDGAAINQGLLWQKESFGARSAVHLTMAGDL